MTTFRNDPIANPKTPATALQTAIGTMLKTSACERDLGVGLHAVDQAVEVGLDADARRPVAVQDLAGGGDDVELPGAELTADREPAAELLVLRADGVDQVALRPHPHHDHI